MKAWNMSHFYISKKDRDLGTYSEALLEKFVRAANMYKYDLPEGWKPYEIRISKRWFSRHCGERMWKIKLYAIEEGSPESKGTYNAMLFDSKSVCACMECRVVRF